MKFSKQVDLFIAYPRCKSENIFVVRNLDIKSDDTVNVNYSSCSQMAYRFINQWKILNNKSSNL